MKETIVFGYLFLIPIVLILGNILNGYLAVKRNYHNRNWFGAMLFLVAFGWPILIPMVLTVLLVEQCGAMLYSAGQYIARKTS